MEKFTFFPKCILYWAGYRATRPCDTASSPDLSSVSLCERSVDIGWEKFPHSHPSGSTDTMKTPYPPSRVRGTRKTSVPIHVQMMNNTPMDLPRKEFQPQLTHASDGNIRITPWENW